MSFSDTSKSWFKSLQKKVVGRKASRSLQKRRSLVLEALESRRVFAAFTAGSISVIRFGDGAETLAATGNSVFIDEINISTPLAAPIQSIALPNSGATSLVSIGTSASEGSLTRSTDGNYLVLAGYGPAALGSALTNVDRVIGRIDGTGAINTSTRFPTNEVTNPLGTGAPRGAATANGTDLYYSGQTGGPRYVALGGNTTTQLSTVTTNLRTISIADGNLYVTAQSGETRIAQVGTGLPTTVSQTMTNIPGILGPTGAPPGGSSPDPYATFFADLDPGVPGLDTLYVADNADGLKKFSLVGGSWVANSSSLVADAYRGVTGVVSGSTVTLYTTRKAPSITQPTDPLGVAELVQIVDTSGYNQGISSPTETVLYVAPAGTVLRGVALSPIANTLPTISTIVDQSTAVSTATSPIAFTVGDAETPIANLTVTATSSNTAIVPVANIVFGGGTGANRNVVITPATGQSGISTITLTVSDGVATRSSTFVLTVGAATNTAPTISTIGPQTTAFQTATSPISFTLADLETPVASLTVTATSTNTTLIPVANVVFAGTGATRTVTITPAAGQSGTSTIRLTVSDGDLSSFQEFLLTVTPLAVVTPIPITGGTYTQNFDSLVNTGNSPAIEGGFLPGPGLTGWAFLETGTAGNTIYAAGTGSSGTGNTYSFGTGTNADRSLGSVQSGTAIPSYGAAFINNTGAPLTSFDIGYTGEQWRLGALATARTIGDTLNFEYSLDATGLATGTAIWTSVPALDFVSPVLPALAAVALDGNAAANRTVKAPTTITPVSPIPTGATFWVRWVDFNVSGSDDGLGIDDFSITTAGVANTTPTISPISNQSVTSGASTTALPFTVGDVETPVNSLTVTATSTNLALVPLANIVISGTGANRTVTATSVSGQTGTSDITLTVSDGTLTATSTFTLTVTPAAVAPKVETIVFGDGTAQRSMVKQITVNFDSIVTVGAGAFTLAQGGLAGFTNVPSTDLTIGVSTSNTSGKTVATLTFSSPTPSTFIQGGSLPDGNFRLTINAGLVTNAGGALDGDNNGTAGGDYVKGAVEADAFFRRFGDSNGNRTTALAELGQLRLAINKASPDPGYNPIFDANSNGVVSLAELGQLRQRINIRLDF